mgnify:CR=1 FL=1|tara:strand:- start:4883 stop:5665 length:783 start_codon:yes stop_codon:yes gene_type:complete
MNINDQTFQKFYSKYYDLVYEKKNYKFECKRIEGFLKYKENVKHILEIGCGTCSHSILLSKKGYDIIGIDNSKEMIKVAKEKIKKKKIKNITLYTQDAEKLNTITKRKFDALLLLFNVIGYIKDLDLFLFNIKKNLKRNSLLIFDFWHEAGIKHAEPTKTIKKFNSKGIELQRNSLGKKIIQKNAIKIDIETSIFKSGKFLKKFSEVHLVKYFNLNILKKIIEKNNFELIKFEDFNEENLSPKINSWNAYCVARFLGLDN